ncbi:hypothetical protein SODALDRAFT_358996 [Sodiomyces alkalinus F11]|uniref:Secreted protein n=1 Tax=Sodiomyces alkalinus (strain CBS 110278 / VKM F-3762 / F11) TaxID=1314773 RepID=A0A3N2PX73_SODAK|nr:hypothetical protein SODALDRAFT_358996 [Sodiomyces alkalinus F11]ROT39130.1 hypothetical protein SODALDRAFT_358996 [Sodiomyces alkalinus F11]
MPCIHLLPFLLDILFLQIDGFPVTLPTLSHLAVPESSRCWAHESGLQTYRPIQLLLSSLRQRLLCRELNCRVVYASTWPLLLEPIALWAQQVMFTAGARNITAPAQGQDSTSLASVATSLLVNIR